MASNGSIDRQTVYDRYYVNFWYGNNPKAQSIVDKIDSLRVSDSYMKQLQDFRARKYAFNRSHSGNTGFKAWSGIFKDTEKSKCDLSEELMVGLNLNGSVKNMSMNDVLSYVKSSDDGTFANTAKGMKNLVSVVNQVLNLVFGPEKLSLFNDYVDELLVAFAKKDGNGFTSYEEKVVRSVLENHSNKYVNIKSGTSADKKLTDANKRLAGLMASLESMSNGLSDKKLTVTRRGSSETFFTGDEIMARLRESIAKALEAYYDQNVEIVDELAAHQLGNLALKAIESADGELAKLQTSSKNSGKDIVRVDFIKAAQKDDPGLLEHRKRIEVERRKNEQRKAVFNRKTSKSDFFASLTSTENETAFSTTIGFSVKRAGHIKYTSNGITRGDIKLQDGTPLYTFLVRDLGFSSSTMDEVVRLAGGKGSTKNGKVRFSPQKLNSTWDKLISYVEAKSLLSALTGASTVSDFNTLYLVLNHRLISIDKIILGVAKVVARGENPMRLTGKVKTSDGSKQDGLERSTYHMMNKWESPKEKDLAGAKKRSDAVGHKILNKMYDTKIRVDLNTNAIQAILRMV